MVAASWALLFGGGAALVLMVVLVGVACRLERAGWTRLDALRKGTIGRMLLAGVMLVATALAPTAHAQLTAGASAVSELDTVLTLVRFDRGSLQRDSMASGVST